MMQTSEAFNHAKNLKLYSWEQKFGNSINVTFNKEMDAKKNMMIMDSINKCVLQEVITSFLPLSVFSLYVYNGNEMTMSQIVLVSMMLDRVREVSRRITRNYTNYLEVYASMESIHKFLVNDEVQ